MDHKRNHSFPLFLLLTTIVILIMINYVQSSHITKLPNHRRVYRRAVRLCSRQLAEGLNLICKDRGFNGPDDALNGPDGPGLVEECCKNICSIQQMEQYCKPAKASTESQ